MIDFRKIILSELERQGRSKYWLAENPGCGIAKNVVYVFLRGETDGSVATVVAMLNALGMKIVSGDAPTKPAPKPRKKK